MVTTSAEAPIEARYLGGHLSAVPASRERRIPKPDQEIISQLRRGQHHKALVKLYAHLPKVERMVRNHGGTRADAKDLFQWSNPL